MQLKKGMCIAGTKTLRGGEGEKQTNKQTNYITWISRLLPIIIIVRNNIRKHHKPLLTEHDLKELSPEGS